MLLPDGRLHFDPVFYLKVGRGLPFPFGMEHQDASIVLCDLFQSFVFRFKTMETRPFGCVEALTRQLLPIGFGVEDPLSAGVDLDRFLFHPVLLTQLLFRVFSQGPYV